MRKTLKQLRSKAERLPHDVCKEDFKENIWLILHKGNVYYCTNFGDPEGTLTVNDNYLKFSPSSLSLVAKSEESLEDALNSGKIVLFIERLMRII